MTASASELVEAGRAALRQGDGGGARSIFERAVGESMAGEVLEGLANAAYLELDYAPAIDGLERAYAIFRDTGDNVSAARAARSLAYLHGTIVGDPAVMRGWLARGQTLLGAAMESREGGWITLSIGMFEGERDRKDVHLRASLAAARRFDDRDLELVTLAYLGASLVHADRTEEGMLLLDEALAGVAGSEVDDFVVLQEIFCQLFAACEHAHDVTRADQWIRIGEAIAERRKLPAVSAFCRTHYGGLLTNAGRWVEADAALTEAVRLWGLGHRALRGGALIRLADLRVRQDRFEEAKQLLDGLEGDVEAARTFAAIHLANGETSLAVDTLERALEHFEVQSTGTAPLLALLVDVHLAASQVDFARDAAGRLETCARRHESDYLLATAALANARVCLATGTGDAYACLREALAGFARAEMPMEVAHSRLELANALAAERPEVAIVEARAALDAFDRMQAARHADAAAAVLRSLGVRATAVRRGGGLLTKREEEVLDLLGHGLSNPEISDRLFISRKTVEHHVGNVLAKLGLRNRGEAAAYAARKSAAE